jgi:uncharacterized protein (DUF342 family)
MLAELQRQREELTMLMQKTAVFEERAFHLAAALKELTALHKQDVSSLQEELQKTRSQLTDVDRRGRKLISSMRNDARDGIAEVREYVQQQKQEKNANVKREVDDDTRSTISATDQAKALLMHFDDTATEVGSTVSAGPRFW